MLIGEKIILRPLKVEDLEKTCHWRNNLELIRLTQGIRFPKTVEMEKEWFNYALSDKSNRNIYFGIDVIESNSFIGLIQLTNIDYISGTAVLGYVIGEKEKRGKGYGKEAKKLIIKYAFQTLNLRKITEYNVSFNEAAIKMNLNSTGFRQEGKLIKHVYYDIEYHDVLIFSVLKEDWFLT